MILVSVIIPTFDRGQTLGRAVASVLDQSYRHLELIVVDDGSTDDTQRVLAEFAHDSRLQVIYQANSGVSSARNAGIAASQGRMLALLDSDDHWLPHKLDRQICFFMEGDWAIVQTDEAWIRHGKRVNPKRKHEKPCGWIFEPSLEMCCVSPSCVLFSREFWNLCGPFDEELPACEDYDLWLRGSSRFSVGFLSQKLVVKTGGHADQLSRKTVGLDLYRVQALHKLLCSWQLDAASYASAERAMVRKANLYIQGCRKRNKEAEVEQLLSRLGPWASICVPEKS